MPKKLLMTAVIALVVILIVWRIPAIRKLVIGA
jgi:hypothetical protein